MRLKFIGITIFLLLTISTTQSWGATCLVGSTKHFTTITKALGNTFCKTILVEAGTYNENLVIDHDVTIAGSKTSHTIIDGGGLNTTFTRWIRMSLSFGYPTTIVE